MYVCVPLFLFLSLPVSVCACFVCIPKTLCVSMCLYFYITSIQSSYRHYHYHCTIRSITRSYYRGAAGAILMFDVTRRESFSNVSKWFQEVKQHSAEHIVLILVGNKIDLVDRRMVTHKEATEFAQAHGMVSLSVSQGV